MNGTELTKTSFNELTNTSDREQAPDRRELEHWASAIASCLQHAATVAPATLGLSTEASQRLPAGWRPGVEALTPDAGHARAGACAPLPATAQSPSSEEDPSRIQVRVKTEEFGEVAVVVERVETGLRVLLGAEDARVVAALGQQSQALRQAMAIDGQAIGAVEIVRMDGLGTNLAQDKVATSNRARRSPDFGTSESKSGNRRKRAKRLDLIG